VSTNQPTNQPPGGADVSTTNQPSTPTQGNTNSLALPITIHIPITNKDVKVGLDDGTVCLLGTTCAAYKNLATYWARSSPPAATNPAGLAEQFVVLA
jgi:hypothetical protein